MNSKQYLDSLPAWDRIQRLDAFLAQNLNKDDVLAAEVSLPLVAGVDVSLLRIVKMRRPHEPCNLPLLVDVSRLNAA